MSEEIWKPVVGYEGLYEVSNMGRIMVLNFRKSGKIQIMSINHRKYEQIVLTKNGERKTFLVHRLVWEAFNGPIPEGMQVNHIDENKRNNNLDNLNLMTPKENTNWGTGRIRCAEKTSKAKKGKYLYGEAASARPILQYSMDGKFIREWDCIKRAADYYGLCIQTMWRYLNGKVIPSSGYIWKYKEKGAA